MVGFVENYTFLNIEDINTVILNEGLLFEEFYDFDTRLLETEGEMIYSNFRFDFILVSKDVIGNNVEYILEIRNSLWDGKYSFIELPPDVENVKVEQVINSPNVLRISANNLEYFVIRLHLTNFSDERIVGASNLKMKGVINITDNWDKDNYVPIQITDMQDNPLPNVKVTLNGRGLKSFEGVTGVDGIVKVRYPSANPGVYAATIIAEYKKGEVIVGSVKKVVTITRLKTLLNMFITGNIVKGSINEVKLGFEEDLSDLDLHGAKIKISYLDQKFETFVDGDKAPFLLNLRGHYKDKVDILVEIEETGFCRNVKKTLTVSADYFYAENWNQVKEESEKDFGADTIRLYADRAYSVDETIKIKRKVSLQGEEDTNGWTIIYCNNKTVFNLLKGSKLEVLGLRLMNGRKTFVQERGSSLWIRKSLFMYCTTTGESVGAVVHTRLSPDMVNKKKEFETVVFDSYFINNRGSCFVSGGQLTVGGCVFKIDDLDYLLQPEPFIVQQHYGDCGFYTSSIDIDTGESVNSGNLSYAKTVVYVGSEAAFNGKTGKQLKSDNSLNLFDSPYNNKAHIYCKYHYPYLDGNPAIVASPLTGREITCAGHTVQGVNWAYKNGYQLTRVSANSENKNRQLFIGYPSYCGWWKR